MALFEVEEKTPPIFLPANPLQLDPAKENILVYVNFRLDEYNSAVDFVEPIIEALEEKANVIVLSDKNIYKTFKNHIKLSIRMFEKVRSKFQRKVENPNNAAHNSKLLFESFKESFKDIRIDKFLITDDTVCFLPLTTYVPKVEDQLLHDMKNEFHDYVGDDPERLKLVKKWTTKINENFDNKVSILAFSMWKVNLYYNLAKYFHSTGELKELQVFMRDPVAYTQHFKDLGIKVKNFYIADDTRGTRNMSKFPISKLQHLVGDRKWGVTPTDLTKTKDFIFAGSVLYDKGQRPWVWKNFIKDLNLPNSSVHIPIKLNGVTRSVKNAKSAYAQKAKLKAETRMADLVAEILNHPNYKEFIFPVDLPKENAKFKYGFIARCVSHYDSLNYRPVFYTDLNVLPLIDTEYDPTFLQIPKDIQERLWVRNDKEIKEKVNYFNQHEDERMEIIEKLRSHLELEYIKKNWKKVIQEKILR